MLTSKKLLTGYVMALRSRLFREDGTPTCTIFVKRRTYAPPCIAIDIPETSTGRYQKRVSIVLKDVEETWRKVADHWMNGLGLSKRNACGRDAYAAFMSSLDPFLRRYNIPTGERRVFLDQ
jgi:hypothetical protein